MTSAPIKIFSAFTQVLRIQLEGTSVTAIEVAPPSVETPLVRGEFEEAMK